MPSQFHGVAAQRRRRIIADLSAPRRLLPRPPFPDPRPPTPDPGPPTPVPQPLTAVPRPPSLLLRLPHQRCGRLLGNRVDLGGQPGEEEVRPEADPKDENAERDQRRHLAERKVADRLPVVAVSRRVYRGLLERTEEDPLHQPEHVPGAQHHAQGGQHGDYAELAGPGRRGVDPSAAEDPQQQRELAGKAVQSGQADAGKGHHQKEEGQHRRPLRQAAEVGDLAGVVALVDHADQGEQSAGREPVIDHLQRAPLGAQGVQGKDAQHAEAQVADAGVGDQPLHVVLNQRHQGPVDDADHRQPQEPRHARGHRAGDHRQAEPQEPIAADLQQHPGQEHASRGGRLHVGQGQPGVQGEEGHFHGKAGEEGQKNPGLGGQAQRPQGQAVAQGGDGESQRPGLVGVPDHDRQQSQESQHAAGESEKEELDGRVTPLLAAPDADEEKQRQQRELEADVKEDDIPGGEDAQHPRLQQQQQAVIDRRPLDDRLPAYQHRDDHQQRRQPEEPEAQAVQTEAQANVDCRAGPAHPRRLDQGVGRRSAGKLGNQQGRRHEGRQRRSQGHPPQPGHAHADQHRAGQRDQDRCQKQHPTHPKGATPQSGPASPRPCTSRRTGSCRPGASAARNPRPAAPRRRSRPARR